MIIWMIVAFFFILGPLLFVHELGHFWALRRLGIPVEEFGFGLGPKVVTLFERGGTKYTIRAIPFAAFVRPAGEEDASLETGMMTARPRVRLAIAAAGPVANIVATLVLLWVAYLFGPPAFDSIVISRVVPASPAELSGLQVNDFILEVDGIVFDDTRGISEYTRSHLGTEITLLVERDQQEITVPLTPRREGEFDPQTDGPIGIQMQNKQTGPQASQNVLQAAGSALNDTNDIVQATLSWPGRIFSALKARLQSDETTGPVAPEEDLRYLRPLGIVGIIQLIAYTLQTGITEGYLFFVFHTAGLISIALGMTNLLPLPGLDGGRVLFAVLDWLSGIFLGRGIKPEWEIYVHAVGVMVLLVLMVIITWQDIVNPLIQFPTPTPIP